MRLLALLIFCIPFHGLSQDDSVHVRNIPSVEIVKALRVERTQTRTIERDEIERLAPIDLGDLLQKLPGTTIRSYGSIGALKTVSFNGLGAQHTSIVLDGFMVSNMLAGQVNLSQVQVEGINSVFLEDERIRSRLLPVKSRLLGNSLMIYSGLMHRSRNKGAETSVSAGYSSFNTYEGGGRFKYSGERNFISAFGYYRESKGDFKYEFENGSSTLVERRTNNDYRELVGNLAIGSEFSKNLSGSLKLGGKKIDQGLPGAIILYNDSQDERLEMDEFEINGNLKISGEGNHYRFYYSGLMRNTVYNDPTYLNSQGFLRNQYIEQGHSVGLTSFHVIKRMGLETGLSAESEFLTTDGVNFGTPLRWTGAGFAKLEHFLGNWSGQYQIGMLIVDQKSLSSEKTYFRLMPRLKFIKSSARSIHAIELSNSCRLPSFNELFYGTIGNPELEPENAYQLKYSATKTLKRGIFESAIEAQVNASYVDNKIVSIPTKNMFVWSIQNIYKTAAASFILANNSTFNFKGFKLTSTLNYQFQKVVDISDEKLPTYLNQIAYIPEHTASFDLGFNYSRFQFNFSNLLIGYRYVLNENIAVNLEEGYLISDLSLRVQLNSSEKHPLTLQGVVKNVFNQQYAYIRGFVMPGRNYVLKLRYVIQ